MEDKIKEAAEKEYPDQTRDPESEVLNAMVWTARSGFIRGATSEAARKYWEQKGWVSVEDKLPEFGDNVLIYIETNHVRMGMLDTDNSWLAYYSDGRVKINEEIFVTHWQLIPSPPTND